MLKKVGRDGARARDILKRVLRFHFNKRANFSRHFFSPFQEESETFFFWTFKNPRFWKNQAHIYSVLKKKKKRKSSLPCSL